MWFLLVEWLDISVDRERAPVDLVCIGFKVRFPLTLKRKNKKRSSMKRKATPQEIMERLKWYHGEEFTNDLLNDDFLEFLGGEEKDESLK